MVKNVPQLTVFVLNAWSPGLRSVANTTETQAAHLNPSAEDVEAGKESFKGPWLHCDFEDSLDYIRLWGGGRGDE